MPQIQLAVHTKACLDALGTEQGLTALTEAGFSQVVFWAGETAEDLTVSWASARTLGLKVASLAIPKMPALNETSRDTISLWLERAIELEAPAVSLMFSDLAADRPSGESWSKLYDLLNSFKLPIYIENNGDSIYRFSNLFEIRRLLENVPALQLELDVGHLLCSGRTCLDLTSISTRIATVDVHDNDGRKDLHYPLGLGTPLGSYIAGMKKLPAPPEVVVIETDPHCGRDAKAWVNAFRADRMHLLTSLRSLFPA